MIHGQTLRRFSLLIMTLQKFYDLGARYVQIDDTTWAYLIAQLNGHADNPEERAKFENSSR